MAFFLLNPRRKHPMVGVLSLFLGTQVARAQDAPPADSTPGSAPPVPAPSVPEELPPTDPESQEGGSEEGGDVAPGEEPQPDSGEPEAAPESTKPSAPLVPRPSTEGAVKPSVPPAKASPQEETTAPAGSTSLKARLDSPGEKALEKPHLPPPVLRPEAARRLHLQADRTEVMPGNFVARPVTLPKGTFRMEFGQTLVLWDVLAESALAPAFGLGITERLEIGVDAPLHHDPGSDAWTALHPRPQIAVTWIDHDEYEIGTRVRALIPGRPTMEPSAAILVPVLWRASPEGRVDVTPELHIGVGSDDAVVARVNAKGTWQISPGMFAGLGATAHVGFVDSQDTGIDPEITFGFTHQNYGRSFVDFVTHAFIKSLGGGESGHFSRGAGFGLSLVFYPDLY